MFVFRRQDLPLDPIFPADLKKLGYFINDKDQIRKIADPTQGFQFKINRNDRWNEVQRNAMNECIRQIVLSRLRDLGLITLCLPLTSGPKKPHVPILVSRNLASASRIILIFGEPVQDLGIWAYRTIGTESINAGSAVDFVKAILQPNQDAESVCEIQSKATKKGDVALVLANTGQLVWHCGLGKAMTIATQLALPRPSAVDPPLAETKRNKIPENRNWQEHVDSVFESIFAARGRLVRRDAKIEIIGASEGGLGAVRYLARNWPSWRDNITALCLANPLHTKSFDLDSSEPNTTGSKNASSNSASFTAFVSSRCRAYVLSPEPLGVPISTIETQELDRGCNCFSSGEELNSECILPRAWKHMLAWLDRAYESPGFCEAQLIVRETREEEVGLDNLPS
ncbi:Arb2 domain-containing protein [Aspergillus spinulosporus]